MSFSIPLSYNLINIPKLVEVLTKYQDQHHNCLIADFENEFGKIIGAPNVVALNSGTSAIHLALKIAGVGPGDYVIVPTFTYVATVNPIIYLGANPVFIDSERETWNMDPALLKKALVELSQQSKKPKAIVIVHTYGMPARMDEILQLAEFYHIPVIEDAAESLGSTYKSMPLGLFGTNGVFSFNNNKIFTTYGGGVLVTKDSKHAQKGRFLASQAREELPYYEHKETGFNYAMNPLAAAAGLAQLSSIQSSIAFRRGIFKLYQDKLEGCGVQFQPELPQNRSNRWLTTLIFNDQATQQRVASVLREKGIESRPLWRPMHLQPVFRQVQTFDLCVSEYLFERGICLPSGLNLSEDNLEEITRLIRGVV